MAFPFQRSALLMNRLERCLSVEDWKTLNALIQLTPANEVLLTCEYETRGGETLQHIITHCRSSRQYIPHGIVQIINNQSDEKIESVNIGNSPRYAYMFSPYMDAEMAMIILTLDLHQQVDNKNWENVQMLIDRVPQEGKIPVFRTTNFSSGHTLLRRAINNAADSIILEGLIRRMDMDEVNRGPDHDEAYSLLHWCAGRSTSLDVIAVVLSSYPKAAVQKDKAGLTPIEMLLRSFTLRSSLNVARLLLHGFPDLVDCAFQDGQTFLHLIFQQWKKFIHSHRDARFASAPYDDSEYLSMIRYLLERKPELAHIADNHLVTPLHLACGLGSSFSLVQDIMAMLSPEQLMECHSGGRNALLCSIFPDTLMKLDVEETTDAPEVIKIVRELLAASYELCYQKDSEGRTVFDLLAFNPVRWCLQTIGLPSLLRQTIFALDPLRHQHKSRNGELVLHTALSTNAFPFSFVKQLVHQVPDQVKEVNEDGNLPLHIAAQIEFAKDDESHPGDVSNGKEGGPLVEGFKIMTKNEIANWEYTYLIMSLLDEFPDAARRRNGDGYLPLYLMIKKGRRPWTKSRSAMFAWSVRAKTYANEIELLVKEHPAAICDLNLHGIALTTFLSRLRYDTMYRLLGEAPHVIARGGIACEE